MRTLCQTIEVETDYALAERDETRVSGTGEKSQPRAPLRAIVAESHVARQRVAGDMAARRDVDEVGNWRIVAKNGRGRRYAL